MKTAEQKSREPDPAGSWYADHVWDAFCLVIRVMVFLFVAVCVCLAFFYVLEKAAPRKTSWFVAGGLYIYAVDGIRKLFFGWKKQEMNRRNDE
jgi:hypothetical protein